MPLADPASPPATLPLIAPFLVAIGIQLIAAILATLLETPVRRQLDHLGAPNPLADGVGNNNVADIVGWGVDFTGSIGTIVAPIIGIALIHDYGNIWTTLILIAIFIAGIAIFAYAFVQTDATTYMHRVPLLPISPVTAIGVLLNVGGLVLVAVAL